MNYRGSETDAQVGVSGEQLKGAGFYIDNSQPSGNSATNHSKLSGFFKVSNESTDKLSLRSTGHQNVVSFDMPKIH